jgi:protein SCO1/2
MTVMSLLFSLSLAAAAPPAPADSIFHLKAKWTDQEGKGAVLADLRGHPTVVAMVYTSCSYACPMTIVDLRKIERDLPEAARSGVRFAIFSFDSERDTPAKLKSFATKQETDPARWRFFHGSPAAVRQLAAALGIRYKRDAAGEFDHSNVISIVDSDGVVRHQQVGLGKDPAEAVRHLTERRKP